MSGTTITYAELGSRVGAAASAMQAKCTEPGRVVLVFMPQSIEAVLCYLGVMQAGLIPSFMPLPSNKQDHLLYWTAHRQLIELIRPAAIIGPADYLDEMRMAGLETLAGILLTPGQLQCSTDSLPPTPVNASEGDTALLQHSSGTTALKKGVALSHAAIAAQVRAYAAAIESSDSDVVVSWLPMYHDMGLIACTVAPLMCGQHVVMLDPFAWVANPQLLFEEITQHKGTLVWLPNFAFELLTKTVRPDAERFDLSTVRAFINCSEPCQARSFDGFLTRFSPIGVRREALQTCYAMAETVFGVTQTRMHTAPAVIEISPDTLAESGRIEAPRPGESPMQLISAGKAISGIRITIVNADGDVMPEGQIGEIELDGDFLFSGYYRREALTKNAFRNGRYRTNDLGFFHSGELYVLGRNDDLIIVHGRNYFAHEIEAIANSIDGLKPGRNVAIPIFNTLLASQEAVLVAEVGSTTLNATELKREIKNQVLQVMGLELRDVSIVPQGWLLKTSSGKISRIANRDKYLKSTASA